MHYRLRENLSCCDVDGHLIFLDIAQDRYFKLTGALEKAMRRFLAHEDVAPTLMGGLAAARILIETLDPAAHATTANIRLPTCSAIEQPAATSDRRLSAAIVVEVMTTVWWVRHQMKTRVLKEILETAGAYRNRKTGAHEIAASTAPEDNLLWANEQFARARRYVPIEPICLLDSLSLLRFLSRRGLPANIVFGVTPEPFAAHCWVQAGEMVLNETLSDANAHTPIRKV
jgi:hypothetical protein